MTIMNRGIPFSTETGLPTGRLGFNLRHGNYGNFSLLHQVQTGSGVHSASYPMGTEGSYPGDKAAGA
jgi:hypothetical protein